MWSGTLRGCWSSRERERGRGIGRGRQKQRANESEGKEWERDRKREREREGARGEKERDICFRRLYVMCSLPLCVISFNVTLLMSACDVKWQEGTGEGEKAYRFFLVIIRALLWGREKKL